MTSPVRTRTAARALAVLALTAPLVAVFVTTSASPALAASTSSSVALSPNQDVFSSSTQVSVKGTITYTRSSTESTTGGGGSFLVYGPDDYSINQPINQCSTATLGASCSSSTTLVIPASAMTGRSNGAWPVKIKDVTQTTFYTNFAPTADPAHLAAAANGRTEVDLSWSYTGTEPDKAGFEIVETNAGSSRTLMVPATACSGSSCTVAVTDHSVPAPGTSETYSYTVTALRSSGGCPGCGSYTRSSSSPSASAQLVGPPPPPSPTPTPSQSAGGGTTGGPSPTTSGGATSSPTGTGSKPGTKPGTGGTTSTQSGTSGGTTGSVARPVAIPTLPPIVATRRAFALSFNHFSPSLGIPKLPPLPATTFPVTAPGAETYQPVLPYAGQKSRTTTKVLSSPIAQITNSIDPAQLARALAVALILLVAAAHVRVFLRHNAED